MLGKYSDENKFSSCKTKGQIRNTYLTLIGDLVKISQIYITVLGQIPFLEADGNATPPPNQRRETGCVAKSEGDGNVGKPCCECSAFHVYSIPVQMASFFALMSSC